MKDLKYYLELPYTIVVRRDEDGDFVARVDELPGCAAHGKDPQEALTSLEEAKQLWMAESLDAGQVVPEPAAEEALPSGKWVQRVPRSLHRKLTVLARREGVSLNQLVTALLSEAVGIKRAVDAPGVDHPNVWEWFTDVYEKQLRVVSTEAGKSGYWLRSRLQPRGSRRCQYRAVDRLRGVPVDAFEEHAVHSSK